MDNAQNVQDQVVAEDARPSGASLALFARQKTVLLTTFRRDGIPVGTPVNIAVDGNRAFARTWYTAGKVKRIRNNPEVTIAASTASGKPTGPALSAVARILTGSQSSHGSRLLTRKYPLLHGVLVPLVHRLRGYRTTHIELTPRRG